MFNMPKIPSRKKKKRPHIDIGPRQNPSDTHLSSESSTSKLASQEGVVGSTVVTKPMNHMVKNGWLIQKTYKNIWEIVVFL